jgi:hypothetical protein
VSFPLVTHVDVPEQLPGTTFFWSLPLLGCDLTGYTAAITIDGLESDVSVPITVLQQGVWTNSYLNATIANSVTLGWAAGVYGYRVVLTLTADSSNAVLAYGAVNVLTPRTV